MAVKVSVVEASLLAKGMERDENHHHMYRKEIEGVPRTRFRPDTRLDLGGRDVESQGGWYGRGGAGGDPAR